MPRAYYVSPPDLTKTQESKKLEYLSYKQRHAKWLCVDCKRDGNGTLLLLCARGQLERHRDGEVYSCALRRGFRLVYVAYIKKEK